METRSASVALGRDTNELARKEKGIMRELDGIIFFFSRSFYESDRLCDAGESRVSGRTDRIAHPIATFLRTYIYRYTRI